MKCMECPNNRAFFYLENSADIYYYKEDGTFDYVDSGESYFESFECVECGSTDVKEIK